MEIGYELKNIDNLRKPEMPDDLIVRWIKVTDDYFSMLEFAKDRNPKHETSVEEWEKWIEQEKSAGCFYCAVFKSGKIVSTASVEKYSDDKWETASVRTLKEERGKGYAKMICYFVTKYILNNGRIATCHTREDNYAMQKVICFLGFIQQ